jgi:hypothetical protein
MNIVVDRKKSGWRESVVPALIQFGILVIVIMEFLLLIGPKNGLAALQPVSSIGDEQTNPNLIRLIYMLVCIPLSFVLVRLVRGAGFKKQFWIPLIAGILLWQGVGECSWHFGLFFDGKILNFPRLEGMQGTFILLFLVLPLFLFAWRKAALSWPVKIFCMSFLVNWLPHWLMIGVGDLLGTIVSRNTWYLIAAICIGLPCFVTALWLVFRKARTREDRYMLSILLYGGLGMTMEGFATVFIGI